MLVFLMYNFLSGQIGSDVDSHFYNLRVVPFLSTVE